MERERDRDRERKRARERPHDELDNCFCLLTFPESEAFNLIDMTEGLSEGWRERGDRGGREQERDGS